MSYFLLFAIRYIALSFVILFLKTCLELLIKCNNMDLDYVMLSLSLIQNLKNQ